MAAADLEQLRRLLAARAQGPGAMAALLADHPDPTVRMLAELWAADDDEAAGDEPGEPAPAAGLDLEPAPDRHTAAEFRLRRLVRRLSAELERLQEINDSLAAALGACPVCWGEEPGCEECGGRGGPGAVAPERELFRRLVLPAVARARRTLPAAAGPADRPRTHPARPIRRDGTSERREE